jgi:hypothetical protein
MEKSKKNCHPKKTLGGGERRKKESFHDDGAFNRPWIG